MPKSIRVWKQVISSPGKDPSKAFDYFIDVDGPATSGRTITRSGDRD